MAERNAHPRTNRAHSAGWSENISSMERARDGLPFALRGHRVVCAGRHVSLHPRAQWRLHVGFVHSLNCVLEALESRAKLLVREDRLWGLEDARMGCAGRVLSDPQLLV